MAALDRFGGPEAWDVYCEMTDSWGREAAEGRTCLDCGESTACDLKGHEDVGYCRKHGCFVTGDEAADPDCFEAA